MSRQGRGSRTVWVVAGGLLLLAAVPLYRAHSDRAPVEEASDEDGITDEAPKPSVPSIAKVAKTVSVRRDVETKPLPERDEVPIMGPGNSDSTANGPRRPHPITPEHERIFRENETIGLLNGAMDVGDVYAMRRMNRRYKAEYPESSTLQTGYDIIADCLEGVTPERRARAERYYAEKRASTVRRYVRRYCMTP